MRRRTVVCLMVSLLIVGAHASTGSAQPLGAFSWSLAPFCNVVTVNVTQTNAVFTLDGFDDQCGAATRASVVGTAFPNPDGTIGIGFSIVATPGAAPVHVDVALSLATLGGTWNDSAGNTGTWIFSPPTPAPGSPRPTNGDSNTAVGESALGNLTTGARNVAIGNLAGNILTAGSDNVYIAHVGAASENASIRIGTTGTHDATFIAGVFGQSVSGDSDQPVLVDATGKLGTTTSSARFKQDIQPLAGISRLVHGLEPVSFRYTPDQQRGSSLQYGLIAEQVSEVMPELVVKDEEGRPLTVKYHLLPTLLLAEIQRLERERATQAQEISDLREELRALRTQR